jgi:hypothetical protein
VKDYGALCDGTTNDRTAFVNALAASNGKALYIPNGVCLISCGTNNPCITLPNNVYIYGDGMSRTILRFTTTLTSSSISLRTPVAATNVTLEKLTLQMSQNGVAVNTILFTLNQPSSASILMRWVEFDGNMTDNGAAVTHTTSGFQWPASGTQTMVTFERCYFHNLLFAFLKTNTATSTQVAVRIVNSDFYYNYAGDIAVNTPAGNTTDVVIEGNIMRGAPTNASTIRNSATIALLIATGRNVAIVGNVISGSYSSAIHLEQQVEQFTIDSNSVDFTCDGTFTCFGVSLQTNLGLRPNTNPNVGVVSDNAIRITRGSGTNLITGVAVVFDSTAFPNAQNVDLNSNVVRLDSTSGTIGYTASNTLGSMVSFTENEALNCQTGFLYINSTVITGRNRSKGCTTGISSAIAGLNSFAISEHTFSSCNTPLLGWGTLRDANFLFLSPMNNSSPLVLSLLPLGSQNALYVQATVSVLINDQATARAHTSSMLSWDGTTFSNQLVASMWSGGLSCVFQRASSELEISCTTATFSTLTDVSIQVELDGIYIQANNTRSPTQTLPITIDNTAGVQATVNISSSTAIIDSGKRVVRDVLCSNSGLICSVFDGVLTLLTNTFLSGTLTGGSYDTGACTGGGVAPSGTVLGSGPMYQFTLTAGSGTCTIGTIRSFTSPITCTTYPLCTVNLQGTTSGKNFYTTGQTTTTFTLNTDTALVSSAVYIFTMSCACV